MAEGCSSRMNSIFTNQRGQTSARCPASSPINETSARRNHVNSQRQLCRFYKLGFCQYGERCRFLHAHAATTTAPKTKPVDGALKGGNQKSANQSPAPQMQQLAASTSATDDNTSPSKNDVNAANTLYEKWVAAPEFVPLANQAKSKIKSYAEVVNPPTGSDSADKSTLKLCPYAEMHGVCSYADGECTYLHGDICELCGNAALHPFNADKRKQHTQECIKQHERNMELSFAVARSREKTCGVCFEVIMEKSAREQRFGILPNCNHCFCLSCIRKWRQAKQFDNKIIRACPECRVTSDFVCPSVYWVDTKEDKEKLIKDYKCALSQKACKYFKQGRGKCPFGNKCFYLHALPDGTKTDVGPPPRQPRRQNHEGEIDMLQQIILWDFLEDRDNRWFYSIADDLEDLVAFFSDSEDSDWSEYDFFFD